MKSNRSGGAIKVNNEPKKKILKNFIKLHCLKNLVAFPTCYEFPDIPTCTDVIIANKSRSMLIFLKFL